MSKRTSDFDLSTNRINVQLKGCLSQFDLLSSKISELEDNT